MAKSTLYLNPSLPTIAYNPTDGTVLSSTGQPTASIDLKTNYPIGVIMFKVQQGAAWVMGANPWVTMKLYTDAAGTNEIVGGDRISFYSKTPSDPKDSMGTFITSVQYRSWRNLSLKQQGMAQYSPKLMLPIADEFSLYENFTLIVAVSTLLASETVNWTESYIEVPVDQKTEY